MKKFIRKQIRRCEAGRLLFGWLDLTLLLLKQEGWNKSVRKAVPIDFEGNPLPWFTYSAIHFLKERLKPNHTVFEFGSGNSTLWLSGLVKQVVSVEHDNKWYEYIKDKVKTRPNIDYKFKELENGQYAAEVLNYFEGFDVIVVDGRDRVQCCSNALKALKPNGVIIFDNTERSEYFAAYKILLDNGFKRIDFWGLGPINSHIWCTTVFYRGNNCFEI